MNKCPVCLKTRDQINTALKTLADAVRSSLDANNDVDVITRVDENPTAAAADVNTPVIVSASSTAMTSIDVLRNVIDPALVELSKSAIAIPSTSAARTMMYAIGMQESRLHHRFQLPIASAANRKGPARGLWQFEAMGGVNGVLQHARTRTTAEAACRKYVGSTIPYAVWCALEYEDTLAAIFARLLLWSDPQPLPAPNAENEQAAWAYYMRTWRPGKPHPETWGKFWVEACAATLGG